MSRGWARSIAITIGLPRRPLLLAAGLLAAAAPPPPTPPPAAPGDHAAPTRSPRALARAAAEAMAGKRYDQALSLYDALRGAVPEAPEVPYNMGVAAYRAGDLDRASELFGQAQALARDPAMRARSAYNLGTTAYRRALEHPHASGPGAGAQAAADPSAGLEQARNELGQALDHYRQALDDDPRDDDARANAELAYRMLKRIEQMQKQARQQQKQDQPQKDQGQSQQDQGQSQSQPKKPPEEAGAKKKAQPGQPRTKDRKAGKQPPPDRDAGRKRMSREEAERLLQGVRDKERRRREALARQEAGPRPPVDKDW